MFFWHYFLHFNYMIFTLCLQMLYNIDSLLYFGIQINGYNQNSTSSTVK